MEELTAKLARDDTAFVYLARDLDIETGNRVAALKLVGIRVDAEPRRVHPGGDLAANVVGFTNREGKGAGGLELSLESVLPGKDGSSVAQVDRAGRVIPSAEQRRTEPVPGHAVQLTIDRDLQWYAQQVLAQRGPGDRGRERLGDRHRRPHRRGDGARRRARPSTPTTRRPLRRPPAAAGR